LLANAVAETIVLMVIIRWMDRLRKVARLAY